MTRLKVTGGWSSPGENCGIVAGAALPPLEGASAYPAGGVPMAMAVRRDSEGFLSRSEEGGLSSLVRTIGASLAGRRNDPQVRAEAASTPGAVTAQNPPTATERIRELERALQVKADFAA